MVHDTHTRRRRLPKYAYGQIVVMLSLIFKGWQRKFQGTKVPWSESSWAFRFAEANVPGNKSSTGTKVPSVDFSLPGTEMQRNEKSRYRKVCLVDA